MRKLFCLTASLLLAIGAIAQSPAVNSTRLPPVVHKAPPAFLSNADKLKFLKTPGQIKPWFVDPPSATTGFGHGSAFDPATFESNSIFMRLTGISQIDYTGCIMMPNGGVQLLIDRIQTGIEIPVVMIEMNLGINTNGSSGTATPTFLVHDNKTNVTQTVYASVPAGAGGLKLIFTMPAQDGEFIYIDCTNFPAGNTWQFYNLQLSMITKFKQ